MLGGDRVRDEVYDVLAKRQRNVAMRSVIPFVISVGFGAVMGPWAVKLWAWATLNAAVQLCDYGLNRRLLSRTTADLSRRDIALVFVRLALSSGVFMLGAAAVLSTRLPLSPALSVLMAAGAILNSIVVSRRSWAAFLALNTPQFAFLIAMPILMVAHEADLVLAPALGLGAILLCACATLTWLSLSHALRSEAEANAELERRRAEAEAARDGRAAFTAAVSHELRTPLTAILAGSVALEARALSEQDRDSAAMIAEASRLMRRLLDDLLDFSKLEAGRMEVEAADFDLDALLDETKRLWNAEAAAKGLALTLATEAPPGLRLRGDALRVRQVLNNLISNALKFTGHGEVRLEARAERGPSGTWRVHLAVADTGVGLDQAEIDRLFQPFAQASSAVARTHGGTGLGLAISRELARLMGGDLTAERRSEGRGCRFTLALTLASAAAPASDMPGVGDEAPASARVLVVDDHPLGRQALTTLLGLRGLEVSACSDGPTALAMLQARRFDLVLADLNMGDLGGREMARRLRGDDGPNRDAPVLAVSGECGEAALAACLAAGMDGLVSKPLEPRTLYDAVDAALAAGRAGAGKDADSRSASAGSSFSSHSQTVTTVQPAVSNAA